MIEIPECKEPESKHLKDEGVRSCLKGLHTPINPHAQRLLAAQAREANKLPKAKAKSKSNQKKDKGKKAQDEKDPEKNRREILRMLRRWKNQVFPGQNTQLQRKTSCRKNGSSFYFWIVSSHVCPLAKACFSSFLQRTFLMVFGLRLQEYTTKKKESLRLVSSKFHINSSILRLGLTQM